MPWSDAVNSLFLIGLPYAAAALLVVGILDRYFRHRYAISSHSTQFLEGREHFWSLVPFHYGMIAILLLHLACILAPGLVLSWTSAVWRLYTLEVLALSLGLVALTGILLGFKRRCSPRLRRVTGWTDWLVLSLLVFQVLSGVLSAILNPWGTAWLASAGGSYLWSLLVFQPEVQLVSGAPFLIKIHLINAFVLIGLLPYTRLLHAVMLPLSFFWRSDLLYRWQERLYR